MNGEKKKRVLIVDDDSEALLAMEAALEDRGFNTTTAWSGQEALKLLRSNLFDLMLLDDHLSDVSSDEILRRIKQLDIQPCVIVTNPHDPKPREIERFVSRGACGVVDKWLPRGDFAEEVERRFVSEALDKAGVEFRL